MIQLYITSAVKDGGVWSVQLDDEGKLHPQAFRKLGNCQYCIASEGKLYVIRRGGANGLESFLDVLDILPDGTLSELREEYKTPYDGVCHLCRFEGETYLAHYMAGVLASTAGKALEMKGQGADPARQTKPHNHFVAVTPDQKYLITTDLGTDTIYVVNKDLEVVSSARTLRGQGPRHLVFSEDGKYVYCICEMASTLDVFSYEDGKLDFITAWDALPGDFQEKSIASAIRLDRGRIYVTNRGHQSVAGFAADGPKLKPLGCWPCGGDWPRDMNIAGDYMIIANERSHSVNILKIGADGGLTLTDEVLAIAAPLCICVCA